jgi:hypothetical protein
LDSLQEKVRQNEYVNPEMGSDQDNYLKY